jgi:hypothetical protein
MRSRSRVFGLWWNTNGFRIGAGGSIPAATPRDGASGVNKRCSVYCRSTLRVLGWGVV